MANLLHIAESSKPRRQILKQDLIPIDNLKTVFRDIRDYFAGNVTGITRDEKIAQNLMRLLFCKIFDEKSKAAQQQIDFSLRPNETNEEFSLRIHNLFASVKEKYPDIFDEEEAIEIEAKDLSIIVSKFEDYCLINAHRDIIADAFEELIGTAFRGGEGQFFTPRNVVQMMIDMLCPAQGERIIDPACGSGGFLAHILHNMLKDGIGHNLYGIDKDLFLSKLAKIYLTLLGENEYHIFCENSLEQPEKWKDETRQHIQLNSFDVILTNPPFGAKIPVVGQSLLKQYELGHQWNKHGISWSKTETVRDKQPPQILFIERILQLLRTGGRAGIVLPEGVFGNPSDRYIWEYIRQYASIIAVVSLSQETFQPSTHTKTSVVFLEKIKSHRASVFFAIAKSIGHNKNGKEIYKMDTNGEFVFNAKGQKIIDDETPEIANNFNCYLRKALQSESHLGFVVPQQDIQDNIYVPESYKPEVKEKINRIIESGEFRLIPFGDLVEQEVMQIKRGNEIGSQHYGSGNIPFIRTTDIVNWEIKIDTVKTISEEVYRKYQKQQDIQENDILFVNDGTFLIGRSSMVTKNDVKAVIQSHLRKIRVVNTDKLNPYYLFYLLNTKLFQEQVEMKTFTQATLSTLGNRIMEIYLPFHTDLKKVQEISLSIKEIIEQKTAIRYKTQQITDQSV